LILFGKLRPFETLRNPQALEEVKPELIEGLTGKISYAKIANTCSGSEGYFVYDEIFSRNKSEDQLRAFIVFVKKGSS
jgi:hypothetical protein